MTTLLKIDRYICFPRAFKTQSTFRSMYISETPSDLERMKVNEKNDTNKLEQRNNPYCIKINTVQPLPKVQHLTKKWWDHIGTLHINFLLGDYVLSVICWVIMTPSFIFWDFKTNVQRYEKSSHLIFTVNSWLLMSLSSWCPCNFIRFSNCYVTKKGFEHVLLFFSLQKVRSPNFIYRRSLNI